MIPSFHPQNINFDLYKKQIAENRFLKMKQKNHLLPTDSVLRFDKDVSGMAARLWAKAAIINLASCVPIATRNVPSVMPAAVRSSKDISR